MTGSSRHWPRPTKAPPREKVMAIPCSFSLDTGDRVWLFCGTQHRREPM
jgi:hypothetical protein